MIIKEVVIKKKMKQAVPFFLDVYWLGMEWNAFLLNSLVTCFIKQTNKKLIFLFPSLQSKYTFNPKMAWPAPDNKHWNGPNIEINTVPPATNLCVTDSDAGWQSPWAIVKISSFQGCLWRPRELKSYGNIPINCISLLE